MKKNILYLSVFILSVIQLSGCTLQPLQSVEAVTMYSINAHSKDAMLREIEKFNQTTGKNNNMRIEFVVKGSDYNEKVSVKAGTASDIITTNIDLPEYQYPINELPGGKEYIKEYYNKNNPDKIYNGEDVYRFQGGYTTMGLLYNKDLFLQAGIVDESGNSLPPRTYDEMREYSKRISNISYKVYGTAIPLAWSNWLYTDVFTGSVADVGYRFYNDKTNKYNLTPYKPVFDMYIGIKKDKSYFPGAETLGNDSARAQFAEGRVGMKIAGSWDAGVINDQFPALCNWGVAPIPTSDYEPEYPNFAEIDPGYSITRQSVEKHGGEVMLKAIKFLYSDEFIRTMYIEGKSIPSNPKIVKDIDDSQLKNGWKEFLQIAETGKSYSAHKDDNSIKNIGYESLQDCFVKEVWTENITVDEFIETVNIVYNKPKEE